MIIDSLALSGFRNYERASFSFLAETTIVLGPNTSGKSNILEAIFLLATGKSFRAESDLQLIRHDEEVAHIKGKLTTDADLLEVVIAKGNAAQGRTYLKKYLVNDIPKRRADFAGHLPALLFEPTDLDIISGTPSLRRQFMDNMLEQIDRQYRLSLSLYAKGIRQRNALLERARETGIRPEREFAYWNELLITHGSYITERREAFLDYVTSEEKELLPFTIHYDHSIISPERLEKYHDAELGAGVTLVGPHRDDFMVIMRDGNDVKFFGSRGQQRLVVLELKLKQLSYMEQTLKIRPLLLLDDIFSELDERHIALVSEIVGKQQTIITTTHEEFLKSHAEGEVIDLRKRESYSF